ncbi:hypothetical protein Sp245p_25545 (plasmid) [Azospirillum baldaniorum]|uniref:Uncharacterized protein n=1 Tax=Azospirillum baldaniorum TaxID=1064539 RepID=A0A9P1JZZ2_9PROT|nr:hypothetical protein Sp245p_25545 [Azospirillum baldaniorum]CCD03018.1 protein of unknown function [Azospirillum baldaniorum]
MPVALPIRKDLSASESRALARRGNNGRVAARMFAISHAPDGVSCPEAARLVGVDRHISKLPSPSWRPMVMPSSRN